MGIEEDLLCRYDENETTIDVDNEAIVEYMDGYFSEEEWNDAEEEWGDNASQVLEDELPPIKRIPECISKYKHLRELRFDHGNVQLTKIKNLDGLTNLRELKLHGDIKKMEGLDTLVNLEKLDLSNCSIEKIENLENLRNLSELDLSGNNIKKIEGLDTLPSLSLLDLGSNDIPLKECQAFRNSHPKLLVVVC